VLRGIVLGVCETGWGDCVCLVGRWGAQGEWHRAEESDGNEDVADGVHDADFLRYSFVSTIFGKEYGLRGLESI